MLPTSVLSGRLGLGDTGHLPLTPQVGLKFGEHTEHLQKGLTAGLTAGRAGVDALVQNLQSRALGFNLLHDLQKVGHVPRQMVKPPDHELVILAQHGRMDASAVRPLRCEALAHFARIISSGRRMYGTDLKAMVLAYRANPAADEDY